MIVINHVMNYDLLITDGCSDSFLSESVQFREYGLDC